MLFRPRRPRRLLGFAHAPRSLPHVLATGALALAAMGEAVAQVPAPPTRNGDHGPRGQNAPAASGLPGTPSTPSTPSKPSPESPQTPPGPKPSTSATASPTAAPLKPRMPPAGKAGPPPKPEDLWVAPTTDELIVRLEQRAIREGRAGGRAAIGAVMAIPQLADEARGGSARAALERIATALGADKGNARARQLASEAATIARSIAPDVGTTAGRSADAKVGLVGAWRIAGPFKDTLGTGLDRAEGPEIATPASVKGGAALHPPHPVSIASFRQADARWDDGAFEVGWRAVPPELASARGVPLDVLLYPRRETCAYLASGVLVPRDAPIVVRVASSGSVRATFDGAALGASDEVHGLALGERIAARVEATKGAHLLVLKVCAGPTPDAGRVRARVTTSDGDPAEVAFTDDLSQLPPTVTPPKVTHLVTPLAAALALGEKAPSLDDALSAALARRLGGADDLRSQHTQGLLDVVVTSSPRPDVLALAGLLAPSRASQTAWLGVAIERSGGDPAYEPVARFARRALARNRLDAGYVDWAASTIATTELQRATDLDARALRARLLDALGRNEEAFAAYQSIWGELGAATPTSVLRAIAAPKLGRPLVAAKARAQALTVWPRESVRDVLASKFLDGPEELKRATIASFRLVTSGEDLEAVGGLLERGGLSAERRRFLLMSTGWAPNRKAIWQELVQALASSPDAKERELAKQALGRARELDPGSPFLRSEQTLAFGEAHPDDETYMPAPSTFLARRRGPLKPLPNGQEPLLDVYDRQLHWLRVVTVDDAGRVAQLVHYSREIVKPPKDASDLDEPHLPAEGDVVEVVRARVHRADGTTAVPQEIDEGEGLRVRWSDLKPGDVVEVATRGYTDLPIGERSAPPFYFLDYAGAPSTHPVLFNEVVVRSPKRHPLYTALVHEEAGRPDVHGITPDAKTGRTVERYVWQNPMTLPEEPLQPKASEIFPTIVGSQFRTWDDFVTWYRAGVDVFTTVDPRVRRKAETLTKGKASRDEKIQAIFNWIADQVKYVNYVSAETWLPNRPQNVLDRMQGDCDDKAMLMMTMFKAIGIPETQEVLVQTRYTGMPSIITAKGAVAPLFDHGIAFLPGKAGPGGQGDRGDRFDRYLDATSPESRIGPLPAMDARAAAIRITATGSTPVVTLPASSPEEHGVDGVWTIALRPDGGADIAIDEGHVGDSAFWLRTSLKQAASAATWLEKSHDVASLPQVQVLPAVDFKGELPFGKATLKFRAKSGALARLEGSDLLVGVRWGGPLVSSLAPLVKRVTPVVLPPHLAPSQRQLKGVITPPPGYRVAESSLAGEVAGGPYGRASLAFERGPGETIVVRRRLTLDRSTIPVAEYAAWRKFLVDVDALFRREVRFVKTRGS